MTPSAPAPKKTSPVVVILLVLAGLFVLAGMAMLAAGWFAYSKLKDLGVDAELMRSNPTAAIAKAVAAADQSVEVVSVDGTNSRITLKEKKTGKQVTVTLDDIRNGRISFTGAEGEQGTVTFGNATAKLPDWLPMYPGATSAMSIDAKDGKGQGATLIWSTKDAPEKVLKFFEDGFKAAGITTTVNLSGVGGVVAGESKDGRTASVIVGAAEGATSIHITFAEKK